MKLKMGKKTKLELYYIVDSKTGIQASTDVWRSKGYAMASNWSRWIEDGTFTLMRATYSLVATDIVEGFSSRSVER